ncbi:MAG: tetratricopeptide repeat protein [Bacteroidaceae bacterium]|nr:tetratricopeptide repeat protein [Bacteroidaceae bacterium]
MKKRYIAFCTILMLVSLGVGAQTLEQLARQAFLDGQYAKAKPMLKKCLRTAPKDARINYWYGASCVETGELEEARSYLQFAADHKIQNAFRYLGRYYYLTRDFDSAISNLETFLSKASPTDAGYTEAENLLQRVKAEQKFMRRVQKVMFVDSVIVNKDAFLAAFRLSPESGTLQYGRELSDAVFSECKQEEIVAYTNEMGNKIYVSIPDSAGRLSLASSYLMAGKWSTPTLLKGFPETGNSIYPFLLSDGITLYFANDGENSMGGYDIFMTRYNSATDRFLKAENAGLPFNSTANDYMMAVDELNGLGWFATDRRCAEGTVCIYTFVWDENAKDFYDIDTDDLELMHRAAEIVSISETQTDEDAVRKARQALFKINIDEPSNQKVNPEITFIIDDLKDVHSPSDFHNAEARALFEQYQTKCNELKVIRSDLESKRVAYSLANAADKLDLRDEILEKEKREMELTESLPNLAKRIRALELDSNKSE